MLTLILNAAEARLQLVIAEGSRILGVQEYAAPSRGTEMLTPALANMLHMLHSTPQEITRIACVAGPGSFTGLRLVLSTAAAYRRATGAKVAPLNSLHALAASLPAQLLTGTQGAGTRVRVLTHARRGLVHGQDFVCGGELPLPVGEPAMWELATACSGPAPDILLGSGVTKNEEALRQAFPEAILLSEENHHPTPAAMLKLAMALPEEAWGTTDPDPLYLRPCDAVENLASIAQKRGQAPEEAYAELNRLLSPKPSIQS